MASAMCTARRARHTGALVSRTATSQRVQGLTITTKISRNNGTGRTVAERPKGNGRAISIGLTTEARVRDAVQKEEEKAKGTREQIPMLHQPFRHGPRKTQVPQLFNKHLCHPLPVHFHMQSFWQQSARTIRTSPRPRRTSREPWRKPRSSHRRPLPQIWTRPPNR